jgi:hypothetical protein
MASTATDPDRSGRKPLVARAWRRLLALVRQKRRDLGISRLVVGGYTITMKGLAGLDLRDPIIWSSR